jgi:uncharacterized protein YndB with AHSA1/START domain
MNSTRVSRYIGAPVAAVYRALIESGVVAQWMFPEGMTIHIHRFDGREGGEFRISLKYSSPGGAGKTTQDTDTYHGRFVKLIPDKLVSEVVEFETTDRNLGGEMTITFRLTEVEGGTEIEVVHGRLPVGLSPGANEMGWQMSLGRLAALLEHGK